MSRDREERIRAELAEINAKLEVARILSDLSTKMATEASTNLKFLKLTEELGED